MPNLVTDIQGYSIHDGPGIRTVVFFKGCGLECQWCSNPECISPRSEIGFFRALCTKCGKCAGICPAEALVFEVGEFPRIDRERCTGCGVCSSVCSYKAIVLYGKPMDTEEIFDAVNRDKMFYEASEGGVTVSGGEALLQSQLVCDLFEKCHQAGIHTCIETSGYAPESALRQVLPHTDYILYDLKYLDSDKHCQYTGKSNTLILDNARVIAQSGIEILFRMPLIPTINDGMQNIKETAGFLHELGENTLRIELMPYHRLGKGKYESLNREYHLSDIAVADPVSLESVKRAFVTEGITCLISR